MIANMPRLFSPLTAVAGLLGSVTAQAYTNTSSESVQVRWIGSTPEYHSGTTFGLPWARGKHFPNSTRFSASGDIDLQSWATAYWTDGSLKWTAHAIPETENIADEYTITASSGSPRTSQSAGIAVTDSDGSVIVDTGKISASFPKTGAVVVENIETASGKVVGQNGRLVLHSQSGVADNAEDRTNSSISYSNFESKVDNVTTSRDNQARALVTVRGTHTLASGADHIDWLPFILRFYLYANSDAIRIVHTLVFDGNSSTDFISGIGLRFDVPLAEEELYNRHVRIAGVDGGLLNEAVKGITGLRRDPGQNVRTAQYEGDETPTPDTWDPRVGNATRRGWIPNWNDYSLTQLSPDGFTLKKRTQAGQSWLNIPGSTRSGGLAYLGGATQGGLAVALRDFWKKYPTGLDIRNAATDVGEVTVWIYSPEAQPLDLRPYHDGLGQETYADQLDALEITYEDWEDGFDTPYGIARTNEFYIHAFEATPPRDRLSALVTHANNPPVLFTEPEHIHSTKAAGTWWAPPSTNTSSALATRIESNLDFLATFYQTEVEQRRWYGLFDFGDIMHTCDVDGDQWRATISVGTRGTTVSSRLISSSGPTSFAPAVRTSTASPKLSPATQARSMSTTSVNGKVSEHVTVFNTGVTPPSKPVSQQHNTAKSSTSSLEGMSVWESWSKRPWTLTKRTRHSILTAKSEQTAGSQLLVTAPRSVSEQIGRVWQHPGSSNGSARVLVRKKPSSS